VTTRTVRATRLGLLGVLIVLAGLLGCETRPGYTEDVYGETVVIGPPSRDVVVRSDGVGDVSAVYRTSDVPPARQAAVVRTSELVTPAPDVSTVLVERQRVSPLSVSVLTPAAALVCEDIPLRFVVANNGAVDVPDAILKATLPPGMRTATGETSIEMNIGLVPAGATREVTVPARAERAGQFLSLVSVADTPGARTEVVETAMVVGQPVLNLGVEAIDPGPNGTGVLVTIRVSNTGNVSALDTVVTATLSPNARLIEQAGGAPDLDKWVWRFGEVPAGQVKETTIRVDTFEPGAVAGTVTATARCADTATATFRKDAR
jgi:hypothetical protein